MGAIASPKFVVTPFKVGFGLSSQRATLPLFCLNYTFLAPAIALIAPITVHYSKRFLWGLAAPEKLIVLTSLANLAPQEKV